MNEVIELNKVKILKEIKKLKKLAIECLKFNDIFKHEKRNLTLLVGHIDNFLDTKNIVGKEFKLELELEYCLNLISSSWIDSLMPKSKVISPLLNRMTTPLYLLTQFVRQYHLFK